VLLPPRVKRMGREADHSSSTDVRNPWSYICTPPYVSVVLS
jgi:hypothetical protein